MASPPITPHPLLTPRQSEILEFIRTALTESGAPPTRDEIARAFGFRSLNAAEQHLQALQKKGLLELVSGTSRGIRLKDSVRELMAAAQQLTLPLIGKVAAGSPLLAQENVLATPAVDPGMFKPRADYLLEVRGLSMRDAGILEGDWLAVHKQLAGAIGPDRRRAPRRRRHREAAEDEGRARRTDCREPGLRADRRRPEARSVRDRGHCRRSDPAFDLTS